MGFHGIVVFVENSGQKSRFFFGLSWFKKKNFVIFLLVIKNVNFSPGLKFS